MKYFMSFRVSPNNRIKKAVGVNKRIQSNPLAERNSTEMPAINRTNRTEDSLVIHNEMQTVTTLAEKSPIKSTIFHMLK